MKILINYLAILFLINTVYAQEGLTKKEKRDCKKMIRLSNSEINKNEEVKTAYYNKGISYYRLGQYSNSILNFKKVVELDSLDDEAFALIGESYASMENDRVAITYYSKSLDLKTDYDVIFDRAICYYYLGIFDSALLDLNDVIKNTEAISSYDYYVRGLVYVELGDYGKGINDFTKSIELGEENSEIYFERGEAYLFVDENQKGLNDLNVYMKIVGPNEKGYWRRGVLKVNLGMIEEGISDVSKAIMYAPDGDNYFFYRGLIWSEDKNEQIKAIEDFSKAVELDPKNPEYYYFRAMSNLALNNKEKACDDWVMAASLGDENSLFELEENCDNK